MSFSVVTGANGYSGKYITRLLLARGERVVTLTGNPDRPSEFGRQVTALPFRFDAPAVLAESLRGASTLYNTYWVRFEKGERTHDRAVANTLALIRAAEEAGVRRLVHTSITNPALDSPLSYFRGKAILEEAIRNSRLRSAILRPAVLFGREDILINNIAFFLRKFPVFAIPGSGRYRLRPIYVEDFAQLAVEAGASEANQLIDAVGPEMFSFEELVRLIAVHVKSRSRIIHVPAPLALLGVKVLGIALGDVVLTRDEVTGLMTDLLVSTQPAAGQTRLSDWLRDNAATLGAHYASEIKRHYRRPLEGAKDF